MGNCFVIRDLETGDVYKTFGNSKEDAVIAFVKGIMADSGTEEMCDMLSISIDNLDDIKTYE